MQFDVDSRSMRKSFLKDRKSLKFRDSKHFYELSLQMYREPPTEDISLMEFEELALNRLKVLRVVEGMKDRYSRKTVQLNEALLKNLAPLMPIACGTCKAEEVVEERRRDLISHFILRLAFCQTPEQTKWFLQQEVDLFKFRFRMAAKNRSMILQFLEVNGFDAELVSAVEKEEILKDLSNAVAMTVQKVNSMDFWKVPFTDALDLVRRRRVLLHLGYTYISDDDLIVILCSRLRIIVSAAMARACKYIGFIEEDARLMPLLRKLTNHSYLGKEYSGKNMESKISPEMVEELSQTSFPLCMRQIHNRLRADHHLRHGARLQYGLFLKGIGLSLNAALAFWRAEFTKKIDSDKFEKEYAYNIRHNYGKEGKRANYPAYPCAKIILGSILAAGDCHGCPYRLCDVQLLSQKLENSGLSSSQISTIVSLANNAHYDKACTRYFEFSHKMAENSLDELITHPNQYYELSRQIYDGSLSRDTQPRKNVVVNTQPHSQNTTLTAKSMVDDDELRSLDF